MCVKKGNKMNLLEKTEQPIINHLKRIYRHNGRWVEAIHTYKPRGQK